MIFIGDIHGNFNRLIFMINRLGLSSQNLVQVGDFGIGFHSEKEDLLSMQRLNDCLKRGDNKLYVIRGNHDNPKFFDGSVSLSNLFLLQDYSVLTIESKTLLLIGGAISIDRTYRKINLNYCEKEVFDFNESKVQSILSSYKVIDIIVTHTAPTFAFPQNFDPIVIEFAKVDSRLLEDLTSERKQLDALHSTIIGSTKPDLWIYGHFHRSYTHSIDDIQFHLLNENEMKEIRL